MWWRPLSLIFLLGLVACEAEFEDLRPEPSEPAGAHMDDQGSPDPDGSDPDPQREGDPDPDPEPDPDPDPEPDPDPDPEPDPVDLPVAEGEWTERMGYAATGTVTLVRRADGVYELHLSEDFSTADLPGPTLVISSEDSLGRALDPATDIRITRLDRVTGAQIHEIPMDPGERRVAWVYCEPFGVEMARAQLVEVE